MINLRTKIYVIDNEFSKKVQILKDLPRFNLFCIRFARVFYNESYKQACEFTDRVNNKNRNLLTEKVDNKKNVYTVFKYLITSEFDKIEQLTDIEYLDNDLEKIIKFLVKWSYHFKCFAEFQENVSSIL